MRTAWGQLLAIAPALAACAARPAPRLPRAAPAVVRSPPPPAADAALTAVLATSVADVGPPAMRTTKQRRATFFAYALIGDRGSGGHATSTNLPQPLDGPDAPEVHGLELLALPEAPREYMFGGVSYSGYRVVLGNGASAPLELTASDSRLPIVQQALDVDGQWRPIEYLPASFCGNSFHTLVLQPGEYWDFTVPRYVGSMPTQLRVALTLPDGGELVSQPVAGSIDPRQFTDREGHRPEGIMDPYFE